MVRRPSRLAIAVAGVAALTATTLSTAAPASAAPPNYCGAGYALIDSYPVKAGTTTAGYYAGPAYTKAGYNMAGKCVEVGGMIEMPNGVLADGGALRVHRG